MSYEEDKKRERKEYLKELKGFIEKVKQNPDKGMKILVKAGIYNKDGKLTEFYSRKT